MALSFDTIKNFFLGSALGSVNNNFSKVVTEFGKVLYRDGSNVMVGNLDMNSNRIINIPAPVNPGDVVNLGSVSTIVSSLSKGDTGPANSTYTSLALLANAPVTNRSYILADGANPPVTYAYVTKNFTGLVDGVNVVALNAVPVTTGALVRQTSDTIVTTRPSSSAAILRTVGSKLRERVSILDYAGADPTWNNSTKTGGSNINAITAAMNDLASVGGGELFFPPVGSGYMIDQPIPVTANKIEFVGQAGLQGGPGSIFVTGTRFISLPNTGALTLGMRGMSVIGTGLNDISIRDPGLISYGTFERNYFVGFRNWDQILLGMRIKNNNFQNLRNAHLGGSDNVFAHNFSNYSLTDTTAGTPEAFWQFQAMSASDFNTNYITCLTSQTNDPIPFDLNQSNDCRIINSQFDGGTACSLRSSAQTHAFHFANNRFTSQATFSGQNHVPILLISSTGGFVEGNNARGLNAGDPFINFAGLVKATVRDNITASDLNDNSFHDFASISAGSIVKMSGLNLPEVTSFGNGGRFLSPHFTRLWTNDPSVETTPSDPRINYFDNAAVKKGMVINCCRTDTTRRWIIYDQTAGKSIYDSATNTSASSFKLVCVTDGMLTLAI